MNLENFESGSTPKLDHDHDNQIEASYINKMTKKLLVFLDELEVYMMIQSRRRQTISNLSFQTNPADKIHDVIDTLTAEQH